MRFRRNALRVKRLHFGPTTTKVDPEFVQATLVTLPTEQESLTPALTSMYLWGDFNKADFQLMLHAFSCSTLVDIRFRSPTPTSTITTLQYLRLLCKGLEAITVEYDQLHPSSLLADFHRLRTVTCIRARPDVPPIFIPASLQSVGALSNLRELVTELPRDTFDFGARGESRVFFPSLQILHLQRVHHLPVVCSFLRLLQTTSLQTFTITYSNQHSPFISQTLADALSLHPSLENVAFDLVPEQPEHVVTAVTGDFKSLHGLTRLTRLRTLSLSCRLHITDSTIDTLCRSWPELRVFKIAEDLYGNPEADMSIAHPRLTLAVLRPLAAHCPRLEAVAVPLDHVLRVPALEDAQPAPRRATPLKMTVWTPSDAGLHDADYARRVGQYISDIYPNVVFGSNGWNWSAARQEFVGDVRKWIKIFVDERARERLRVQMGLS